jgi:hypothetical protein
LRRDSSLLDWKDHPGERKKVITMGGKLRCLLPALLLLPLLGGVVAPCGHAQRPRAEVIMTIDGDSVYRLLPPDAIPAVHEPEFVTGSAANEQMLPEEPVLGVVVGGEAHAYSLWHLDAHEIVNDVVGGVPIAATW